MGGPDVFQKYPFLRDPNLTDDLKKFLVDKSIQTETVAWANQLEVRKWKWSTPLAIALTGLITIGANFGANYWIADQKQKLDDQSGDSEAKRKAAAAEREFQYKIVERELTQDKPEKDRAKVLLFLVRSGVLNGLNATELRQMAEDTLANKSGANVPSLGPLRQNTNTRTGICDIPFQEASPRTAKLSDDWIASNLIDVHVPQLQKFVPNGKIRFNKIAATALKEAFKEIEALTLLDRIVTWNGAFVPRLYFGSILSVHACGIAFDINTRWNLAGNAPTAKGEKGSVMELVPIFKKHGFKWGGLWPDRSQNGGHFEYVTSSSSATGPSADLE